MKKKKVLIIGAGIAGLSAGSYLERNSYDTEIFELHSIPGGLCTAWKRGDYVFDYCIEWLMGTRKGTGFDTIWDELGALRNEAGKSTEIIDFEEFISIELPDGDMVSLYADTERLKEELIRVAPEDEKTIIKFIKDMRKLARYEMPVLTENWGIKENIIYNVSNVGSFLQLIKYARMTMEEFTERWQSSVLKKVFSYMPPSWSAISFTLGLAMQDKKAAGYPLGGSLPFARNIEREYLKHGGSIHYSSRVEKILVKDDRAIGIKLDNGEEYYGDEIVSAADGYSTLFEMLDGCYLNKKLEKAYQQYPIFPSTIFLGFGVAKDLSDYPHAVSFYLPEPLQFSDGSEHQYINLKISHYDPDMAPEGKTAVTVLLSSPQFDYWHKLARESRSTYEKEKSQIKDQILEAINEKIPGFSEAVEETDVSTPHTVKMYTNNWRGSFEGFAPTPQTLSGRLPKEVPGLENCHMIGQWTEAGGGLPPAALDGRNLAIKLCKKDNKDFIGR